MQRETVDKYLYMNHDGVLEAKSPWHLYISINWSVIFIVTTLLLSHFIRHIIYLFSTSSFLFFFLTFLLPILKRRRKKKNSYSPYLSTFIITLPPTFSLPLYLFISPLLSTLPLQFLYLFPFLILWFFFFLFYFV